jgi:hypothetical protein
MRRGSTCVRKLIALVIALACAAVSARAGAATNDASIGYEAIRPSLVKVWAFDRSGKPTQSGTGLIVDSGDRRSLILTATHVVEGAESVRIDVSRDVHDLTAHVERAGPRDLTLLSIERGGLRAARFAARTRPVVEGNLVAVAGYVKNDELIGVVGQEPRILFPGTISSRPDEGRYLELENVHIEEGLSGGAVFDPATGDVLGIVTSRTTDRRGGFADSGAFVVLPFLAASRIASAQPLPALAVATPAPVPRIVARMPRIPLLLAQPAAAAHVTAAAHATAVAHPNAGARPVALHAPAAVSLPAFAPRLMPSATLLASISLAGLHLAPAGIVSWQSDGGDPKRFNVTRAGCRIALTIDVQTLQFVVAHQALVTPHHHGSLLGIVLQQRAGNGDACNDVADAEPTDGAYEPTAMSFDGKHVTMRFVYAGDPANEGLFPADASLDADLTGPAVTATVQFFGADWNGAITVPLAGTPLAAVSSTW